MIAHACRGFVAATAAASENHGAAAIKSLAVLPLKNLSGDPAQEYLADGMTEELIGRLAGIQRCARHFPHIT